MAVPTHVPDNQPTKVTERVTPQPRTPSSLPTAGQVHGTRFPATLATARREMHWRRATPHLVRARRDAHTPSTATPYSDGVAVSAGYVRVCACTGLAVCR